MGMYKYVRELWKAPRENLGQLWQQRILEWKGQEVTVRVDAPTRIDKARSLGYKAKQGYVLVRQRVDRGGRQRPQIRKGRKSRHFGRRKDLNMSYQSVAEQRAVKKYPNCEVLSSYHVGDDGQYFWYEVILIDKAHPQILADHRISWISTPSNTRRAFRGLTTSSRRSRGLMNKGKGAEKFRPSREANINRRKD